MKTPESYIEKRQSLSACKRLAQDDAYTARSLQTQMHDQYVTVSVKLFGKIKVNGSWCHREVSVDAPEYIVTLICDLLSKRLQDSTAALEQLDNQHFRPSAQD
jgi:hypothetical protein